MNGVAMTRLTADLARLPASVRLPARPRAGARVVRLERLRLAGGWWTAVIIGMLNTALR